MVTIQEITQAILEAVTDIYHKKYTGKIEVKKLQNGYTLVLGLNNPESPLTISAEGSGEEFIEFVKKELHSRGLHSVKYFSSYKYEPEDKCDINNNI